MSMSASLVDTMWKMGLLLLPSIANAQVAYHRLKKFSIMSLSLRAVRVTRLGLISEYGIRLHHLRSIEGIITSSFDVRY